MKFKKTVMKNKTVIKTDNSNDSDYQIDNQLDPSLEKSQILNQRYEIIEKIGQGSFSTVYRVFDKNLETEKALKIFGDYEQVQLFYAHLRNEATLLIKLNHPNIVRIYDFVDAEFVFLDMEYINGSSLDTLIASKSIKKKQAVKYATQMASALNHAHEQNIAHLDVKPENILIDIAGNLKLTDFGISKMKHKKDDTWAGTIAYMPPEKLKNEGKDNQCDIFAFGITLYEMLYSNYPFFVDPEGNIDYTLPQNLKKSTKKIDQIIKKCLYYFEEDRYQNFQDILNDIQQNDILPTSPIKTMVKKIYNHLPIPKISSEIRKEFAYLIVALSALILALPFFIITQNNINTPLKEVMIDSPPYSIMINLNDEGAPPLKTKMKKGDHLQFKDSNGNPVFDYIYNGEKKIKVVFQNDKILVNKKIKGQIIHSRLDLPLSNNLSYIRSDISLSKLDLKKQKNKRLSLHLNNPDENDLDNLPLNLRFLNLHKSKKIKSLAHLAKFPMLSGLDLSEMDSLNFDSIPKLNNLTLLNIKKTKLNNLFKLSNNATLKFLNLDQNPISSLEPIKSLNKLEIVSNNQDSTLCSASPFLDLPNLRSVSTNQPFSNPTDLETLTSILENNKESMVRRQKIIEKEKTWWNPFIFYMVTLLMSIILFLLIRIMLKKLPKNQQESSEIKKEVYNEPPKKQERITQAEIQKIDNAIKDNRLYQPHEDNALYHLQKLQKKNVEDKVLDQLKEEICKLIEQKITTHYERYEFEPIYIASSKTCEILPNPYFLKQLKISQKKLIYNSPLKFKTIKGGKFQMGDFTSKDSINNFFLHTIELSSFLISQTVVTNDQFCEFLNIMGNKSEDGTIWYKEKSNYSRIQLVEDKYKVINPYGSFPVYEVSWYGAHRFCEWKGGRLPTEAEWEFVARNRGQNILYPTGEDITKKDANYLVDASDTLWHSVFPVKTFKPNKLKLYELGGNVLEWCYDWYDKNYYHYSEQINPKGPNNGDLRVVRGGGWCFPKENMKTFFRGGIKPGTKTNYLGFRIVIPK